jgi:hypothetical protein
VAAVSYFQHELEMAQNWGKYLSKIIASAFYDYFSTKSSYF